MYECKQAHLLFLESLNPVFSKYNILGLIEGIKFGEMIPKGWYRLSGCLCEGIY